jgi:hypothetical protein
MAGSILETFLILFESDAKDAKKDADGLNKTLDKTEKEAKKVTTQSQKLSKEFVKMGKSAFASVASIVALGASIKALSSQAQSIAELGRFSDSVGENIEMVNAWGNSVERFGGTAEGFRSTIQKLNKDIFDLSVGGESKTIPFFNHLGIELFDANKKARSILDVLPEIADQFAGLTAQEAQGLGENLGLDAGTIRLLQQGRREVESMITRQKELGLVSQQAADVSIEFSNNMKDLKQTLSFSAQTMLIRVLPAVNAMLSAFTDISIWVNKNQTLVEGFFIGLGAVILRFAIPPMISLAAATLATIAPFLAVGVAVAGLLAVFAIAFEDIKAFINGQDSLVGRLVDTWSSGIDKIKEFIMSFVGVMKDLAKGLADLFMAPLKIFEKLKGATGFVKGLFSKGDGDDSQSLIEEAQSALELASNSSLGSQTSNSIQNSSSTNNRSTSVNVGDIVINTQASDSDAIASDIQGSINDQLRAATDNFDDGVFA